MKRFASLMLALIIMTSLNFSYAADRLSGQKQTYLSENRIADKVSPDAGSVGTFFSALLQWLGSLNLNGQDIAGRVTYDPGVDLGVKIKQEGGILETVIDNVGRFQVSENLAAADLNGQRIIVDLVSLSHMILSGDMGQNAQKDLEMLMPWLRKAFFQIIYPCVKSYDGYGGTITAHVQADSKGLEQKIRAFVDEMMEEEDTLRTLMDHYGKILAAFIPGMKDDFEWLKHSWDQGKRMYWSFFPEFCIDADVTYRPYRRGTAGISVKALIQYDWNTFNLDFEYETDRYGTEIKATFRQGKYYYEPDSLISLSLKYLNIGRLDGQFVMGGQSYVIYLEEEKDDALLKLKGKLLVHNEPNRYWRPIQFLIDGSLQEETGAAKLVIDRVYLENGSEIKQRIFDADMTVTAGEVSGTAVVENEIYDFRISANEYRTVIQLNSSNGYWYNRLIDFTLTNTGWDTYNIRLESSLLWGTSGRVFKIYVGRELFEAEIISSIREFYLRAEKVRYNGHPSLEFEYYNISYLFPQEIRSEYPIALKIVPDGRSVHIETDFMTEYMMGEGTGNIYLDGNMLSFEAEVTLTQRSRVDRKTTYKAYSGPNSITYESPEGIYVLEIKEETSRRFSAALTKDGQYEIVKVQIDLDPTEGLTGELYLEGERKGMLILRPEEKTPIVPIESQGAIVIDEKYIETLVQLFLKSVGRT